MKVKTCPWSLRGCSLLLAIIIPVTSMPGFVWAAAEAELARPNVGDSTISPPHPEEKVPPVTVNRRPASRVPFDSTPTFSAQPTVAEFAQVRGLEQVLIPVAKPNSKESKSLANTLKQYASRENREDQSQLLGFLEQFPNSPWKPALLINLGIAWRRTGYFTKAMKAFEDAWNLTKSQKSGGAKQVGDRAFAELVQMNAWLGRHQQLEPLMKETGSRQFTGASTEMVSSVRRALWIMQNKPEEAFMCGPYALRELIPADPSRSQAEKLLSTKRASGHGFNLAQVKAVADEIGLKYQMAKRKPGSAIPVNSVIHWKLEHFGAVLKEQNGRYLIQDATFAHRYGHEMWINKAALEEEGSGYFLIPDGPLPTGWESVSGAEGEKIWGRGETSGHDPRATCPRDDKSCPNGDAHQMPVSSVHLMVLSVNIVDIPVGYAPPKGPGVDFRVTYNQREHEPLKILDYSNLGPNWTHDYFAYIEDNGVSGNRSTVTRHSGGGGWVEHKGFDSGSGLYTIDRFGGVLQYFPPPQGSTEDRYELVFSDGSRLVFEQPDVSHSGMRKMLLTQIKDAAGNAVVISYDATGRITHINDALGQTTTLHYDLPGDSKKITSVEDPFGRTAIFKYDQPGRLKSIADVGGLLSSFSYGDSTSANFINTMTTPYGATTFLSTEVGYDRTLLITDPNGDREYFVSDHANHGLVSEVTPYVDGLPFGDCCLIYRNTYYFGKKVMLGVQNLNGLDYNNATIYHWFHGELLGSVVTSSILESKKAPLQSRLWYWYPGQSSGIWDYGIGFTQPSVIARVVEDPASPGNYLTQTYRYEYNARGRVTKFTDPMNRVTELDYYSNGFDLQKIRQTTGGTINEVLAEFGTYNSAHHPAQYTDAARKTYALQWNPAGQLTQMTNPKNEVTRMIYDSDGYLQTANLDWLGGTKTTTLGYDGYGRIRTETDSENYTLTYDYDVFDRLTKVTYPDATYEQLTYDKLDVVRSRDRNGRFTQVTYDKLGRPLTVKDRLNQITSFAWCGCGGFDSMTDPLGHTTTWQRDVAGRVTDKIYHDGKTTHFDYQPLSGRVKAVSDPKNQVKTYGYNVDGTLLSVAYTDKISGQPLATPGVSFTYEPNYRRLSTMVDGTGTTSFGYHPITVGGTLGAGRTASVDGPLLTDTITYGYDELGRATSRAVNAVGESFVFDTLGRVTSQVTPLGTFTAAYIGDTFRLDTLTHPNLQVVDLDYFDNLGDHRLKQIWNKNKNGVTLSKFDYQYDKLGRIREWSQQADAGTPQVWKLDHDLEDQLVSSLVTQNGSGTKGFSYGYDAMGNRTSEQVDTLTPSQVSTVTKSGYNNVNQLTSRSGTGPLPVRFQGKMNEPGTATVNGVAAKMTQDPDSTTGGKLFAASLDLPAGNNTVPVVATDFGNNGQGNVASRNYTLTVAGGAARTLTYDNNGNCTANGSVTYEWDAENRLVAIVSGTLRSEFTYDGFGRRVKIVEKNNGVVTSTRQFVWRGKELAEERDGNNTVTKRYYAEGMQVNGSAKYFYTRDHLGSVREMTGIAGAIRARYDYDPYGRVTKLGGDLESDMRYTGHYYHAPSGLHLALYRAYDAELGRWLNRDPIGEAGGINLYGYVGNDPVIGFDRFGLSAEDDYFSSEEQYQHAIEYQIDAPYGYFQNEKEKVAPALETYMDAMWTNAGLLVSGVAVEEALALATAPYIVKACEVISHNRYFRLGKGWVPEAGAKQFRAAFGGKDKFIHGHIDSSNWYKPWKWFKKIGSWKQK